MNGWMIDVLLRLSRRERGLLAVLALVLAPALIWMGLVAPLLQARAQARLQAEEVRALGQWVVLRAAEQAQVLRPVGSDGGRVSPPIGISGLEQSLVAAALRHQVSRLGGGSDGRIELGFDAVDFEALASWLSQAELGWGYEIAVLRLQRGAAPGQVAVELVLHPPESAAGQP